MNALIGKAVIAYLAIFHHEEKQEVFIQTFEGWDVIYIDSTGDKMQDLKIISESLK